MNLKNLNPVKQSIKGRAWFRNGVLLLACASFFLTNCAPKQQVSHGTAAQPTADKAGNNTVVAGHGEMGGALPASEIGRYIGSYQLAAGERTLDFRVYVENGNLMAQATGQPFTQMIYDGNHTFKLAKDPAIRLVFTIENNRAEGIQLHQGGRVIQGKRIQ